MTVLGYMEMQRKDQPPREIWLDDEAIEAHFKTLELNRDSGNGSEPVPDLEQNSLTKGLK